MTEVSLYQTVFGIVWLIIFLFIVFYNTFKPSKFSNKKLKKEKFKDNKENISTWRLNKIIDDKEKIIVNQDKLITTLEQKFSSLQNSKEPVKEPDQQ